MNLSNFKIVNIDLVEGNTLAFTVESETPITNLEMVAKDLFEKTVGNGVILLTDTVALIKIEPADTQGKSAGVYDYEITIQNDTTVTTLVKGSLTLYSNLGGVL